jgi:lipopolysaccharide biosynthesis glycosyltransferase
MFYLLLESIFNYHKIKFEINDNKYNKSKLDLFNLSYIKNYDKILYLDNNIIVKDDINSSSSYWIDGNDNTQPFVSSNNYYNTNPRNEYP